MPLIPRKFPPWGGGLFEVCCAVLRSQIFLIWGRCGDFTALGSELHHRLAHKCFLPHIQRFSSSIIFSLNTTKPSPTDRPLRETGFPAASDFLTCYDSICCSPTRHTFHLQHTSACPSAVTLKRFFPNLNSFSLGAGDLQ